MNSKYRFAFVSNSKPVADTALGYAASIHIPLEVSLASMEDALPVARKLLEDGVDVILGGGGTGKLLRRHLHRPVVTIARSHLDILKTLLEARKYSNFIACTCYGTIPPWPPIFSELLGIRILPIPFSSTMELVNGISQAISCGVGCVVGGGVCSEIAEAQGCKGFVITPGREALERAFEEAINIVRSQHKDREHTAWLAGILESLHEGIIGVDSQGTVATSNNAAEVLLQEDIEHLHHDKKELLESLGVINVLESGQGQEGFVRKVNDVELVINTLPVMVGGELKGALAAFEPTARVRNLSRMLIRQRKKEFIARYSLDNLIGNSDVMKHLREQASNFAKSTASLHIQGESGTGKELLAHGIHMASPRKNKPFVALNCGVLPDTLLQSELFGYEEGAFTGARRGGKEGLFEMAHGGTIFLDEIADISPSVQILLLRVLETNEIFRLGGDRPISVDVRIISSTWKNLVEEVRVGRFRSDLYYRLTLLRLSTPALRDRLEDIPSLAKHLLERMCADEIALTPRAIKILQNYTWPGNIRELDALLHRYYLTKRSKCDEELIKQILNELQETQGILTPGGSIDKVLSKNNYTNTYEYESGIDLKSQISKIERNIIVNEINKCNNNRGRAARNLGISVNTLWRKLHK